MMIHFRPTVESLGVRTLPSAVLARPEAPAGEVAHTTVTIDSPIHNAAKVTMNDISITIKVSKSSPG
jgi:hypothetical protein